MKKYSKFLFFAATLFVMSSVFAQRGYSNHDRNPYGDRNDDRYENGRYENDRYGHSGYENNWVELGSKAITSRRDFNKININPRLGWFRQLRFDVNGMTDIYRVAVKYDNGYTEELNVRNNYGRRDARSNNAILVDLPNRNRNIRQIIFWADNDNLRNGPFNRNMVVVSAR